LFVSDLHLDAAWPHAIAQFLGFLESTAPSAEALYVLAICLRPGSGMMILIAARPRVCAACNAGSARHPCYVMHGNRDFLLQSVLSHAPAASCCTIRRD